MSTLASPISNRPSRCTSATRRTSNRAQHFRRDFAHFVEGHRLVREIFEIQRGTPARMISYDALEDGNGAVLGRLELGDDFRRADRLANQFAKCGSAARRIAAADRGQKRHFVPSGKRRAQIRELLVHRGDDRTAEAGKFGMPPSVAKKEIFHPGAFGNFRFFLGATHDLFQTAKKKNAHPHPAILAAVREQSQCGAACPRLNGRDLWTPAPAAVLHIAERAG